MSGDPVAATGAVGVPAWPDNDSGFHDGPRSIHAHVMRPIVEQLAKAGAHTVLDLGCGNGWFTQSLVRCGFEVLGVDHNEAVLAQAQQQRPLIRFQTMDVLQGLAPGLSERFDAVVAIDLIDHVTLPRRMIETALDALKPGGLLVVTCAYYGYAKNLALALAGRFDSRWDPLLDEGRLKFFSRATLTALLLEAELQDLHFQTVGRIPMFARSMVAAARKPT
ncbi:MAG: class I SAM-dependent methyltransferase [Burkholderiaceae bacterium]|nr:class I SAM-dependent methyltransferase [Burkholderiaceae bacterium]